MQILRKILLIVLLVIGVAGYSHAACVWSDGDTVGTAASTSQSDIEDCLDDAECTNGDTIIVPTGSSTWASDITVATEVKIQGDGSGCPSACDGSTTITDYCFSIEANNVRITGFTFNGSSGELLYRSGYYY